MDRVTGRFVHYSGEPLPGCLRPLSVLHRALYDKPGGLWFSVEGPDDWPSWCLRTGLRGARALRHQTEIIFRSDARLLHLKSVADIRRFTDEYEMQRRHFFDKSAWQCVARKFQGIIIAPFQREICLDDWCFWYRSWGCASGVVWDADAISELIPLDSFTAPRRSNAIDKTQPANQAVAAGG